MDTRETWHDGGMSHSVTIPFGWQLNVEQEQVEVTSSLPRPNRNWRYTDHAGHEHDASRSNLRWVQDGVDRYDDGDGYVDEVPFGHLECVHCAERIEPGTIGPSAAREFIPGLRTVTMTAPDGTTFVLTPDDEVTLRSAAEDGTLDVFVNGLLARKL